MSPISLMNAVYDDDNDDTSILVRLTKTTADNDNKRGVHSNAFQQLSNRFLHEDIHNSSLQSKSHENFWNDLITSFDSFGFSSSYIYRSNNNNNITSNANHYDSSSWINFDSDAAKLHLDAVISLLSVSNQYAKLITKHVLEQIMVLRLKTYHGNTSNNNNNENEQNNDDDEEKKTKLQSVIASSLLGTKKLLLLVQEHHYQQQISRIRFITEALRQEQDDHGTTTAAATTKQSCRTFLDNIDKQTLLVHNNSHDNHGLSRGLFKILVCMACAPVESLQRDHLVKSFELHSSFKNDDNDDVIQAISSTAISSSLSSQQTFVKTIMELHMHHHGYAVRTEALESIFMLLYTKIQGGITRGDYLLLLQAFEKQHFFTATTYAGGSFYNDNTDYISTYKGNNTSTNKINMMKRRSQLVAFIMAECMSLWHATYNNTNSNINIIEPSETPNEWVRTHPFLRMNGSENSSNTIITSELIIIGNLLLEKYSKDAIIRRQKGMQNNNHVDVPESIAILTFGLLLKMASRSSGNSSSASSTFSSSDVIKKLSFDCITIANDECAAFEYIEGMLNNFLPDYKYVNEKIIMFHNNIGATDNNEWIEFVDDSESQAITAANADVLKYDVFGRQDGALMSYASIAREILVATLSSFQGRISVSDKEDIFMMTRFATKVYRNNIALCSQFWSDWELESRNTTYVNDPTCFLLDVLYQVAHTSLNRDISADDDDMIGPMPFKDAKFAASILPQLHPFLSFITSLIPSDGEMVLPILRSFLNNGIIYASVLGCFCICTAEETNNIFSDQTFGDYHTLLESASNVMDSLSVIATLIPGSDVESISFLRDALGPMQSVHGDGTHILHNIASSAYQKMRQRMDASPTGADFELEIILYSRIVASSLLTMGSFLQFQRNEEERYWIDMLLKSISRKTSEIGIFVKSNCEKVASAGMNFLYMLTSNIVRVVMSTDTEIETVSNFFHIVKDGSIAAIELLSSLNLKVHVHHEQSSLACVAMFVLEKLLYALNDIALIHRNEKIQNYSIDIRDAIILNLSGSTSIGNLIGFSALSSTSNTFIGDQSKTIQGLESSSSSILVMQSEQISMQLGLSLAALSLLVAWMHVAEQKIGQESIRDNLRILSDEEQSYLASNLLLISPIKLLFSAIEQPKVIPESIMMKQRCSYCLLSGICKYIRLAVDDKGEKSRFYQLAIKALKLACLSVSQAKIISSGNHVSSDIFYSTSTVQQIGFSLRSQLQIVLQFHLQNSRSEYRSETTQILLKLLNLVRSCIISHPFLAKEILGNESGREPSIILNVLATLNITQSSSIDDVLIATSSAKLLVQLWKCSREQDDSGSNHAHPCKGITCNLIDTSSIFNTIVEVVSQYESQLFRFQTGHMVNVTSAMDCHSQSCTTLFKHTKVIELFISLIEIIALELKVLKNRKGVSGRITYLVNGIFDQELLKLWFKSLSFDSINIQSKCQNALLEDLSRSKFAYSKNILYCFSPSITSMDSSCNMSAHQKLCQASKELFEAELEMLHQLVTLLGTVHVYYSNIATMNLPSYILLLEEVTMVFTKMIDMVSTSSSSLEHRHIFSQIMVVANTWTSNLLIFFSCDETSDSHHFGRICRTLEALLHLNAVIGAGDTSAELLKLRINIMTVANITIHKLKEVKRDPNEEKKFWKVCLRCCVFVCETLALLDSQEISNIFTAIKDSNFIGDEEIWLLLRNTIICMSLLVPDNNMDNAGSASTLQRDTYLMDFTQTIRNYKAVPYFISLLEKCSLKLSKELQCYKSIENHVCFETIITILDLFATMVLVDNSELPVVFMENHLINIFMQNSLLLYFRDQCIARHGKTANFRGYRNKDLPIMNHASNFPVREADPLHTIWLHALQIIASFIRSSNTLSLSKGTLSSDAHERNIVSVDDFLNIHKSTIETFTQQFEEISSNMSRKGKDNEFSGFSAAILKETDDFLSLISALCTLVNMKVIEGKCQTMIQQFASFSIKVIQSLSPFLGAIGISNELFSMLNQLNEINEDEEMLIAIHEMFASHPLFADGVSQAKHEGIRHSLFVNNFCSRMTENDLALSQLTCTEMHPNSDVSMCPEVEQFQDLINNKFICQMEVAVASSIFNALSVVTKIHTAFSSFISFSVAEAAKLRLSSAPPNGTVVILRQQNTFIENIATESFARIIGVNEMNQTLVVQYMDSKIGDVIEDNVAMSRLVAMQDISRRINLFKYKPAAESICNPTTSNVNDGATIGNLIHILRWCGQFNPKMMRRGDCLSLVSEETVKCVAEVASIILAHEISMYHEVNSISSTNIFDVQNINRQLLDLFDNLSDSNNIACKLRNMLTSTVWKSIQRPLTNALNSAKADKENIRKHSEHNSSSLVGGWSKPSYFTSRRRSPFK